MYAYQTNICTAELSIYLIKVLFTIKIYSGDDTELLINYCSMGDDMAIFYNDGCCELFMLKLRDKIVLWLWQYEITCNFRYLSIISILSRMSMHFKSLLLQAIFLV